MLNWLLYPLGWLIDKIAPFPTDECYERFIKPQIIRAQALGLSDDEIGALWQKSLSEVEIDTVGFAPGSRLAANLDIIEAEKARARGIESDRSA